MAQKKKIIKLHYWNTVENEPFFGLFDNPNEVRLGVGGKSFLSIKEDSMSLSGGTPSIINIQGLSSSMHYAGMIQDLPFPLSLMPTTTVNPFPKQIIVPPLADLIPTITQAAQLVSMVLGV